MADEENTTNKLLALIIASALAGVTGSAGYRAVAPSPVDITDEQLEKIQKQARPDPYTGTEGKLMEKRSLDRHNRQQKAIDANTHHRITHEINAQRYIVIIEQLQADMKSLKRAVHGHD